MIATAERLRDFPAIGRPGRLPGMREFSIVALPYLIVYAVRSDVVTIVAVFHSARDLSRAPSERRRELEREDDA